MMEVRCCCDAGRLLGWLPDPTKMEMRFRVVSASANDPAYLAFEVDTVNLSWGMHSIRAYKSRDYPLELLRRIPEFVEANEDEIAIGSDKPVDCRTGHILLDGSSPARRPKNQLLPGAAGVVANSRRAGASSTGGGSEMGTGGVRK